MVHSTAYYDLLEVDVEVDDGAQVVDVGQCEVKLMRQLAASLKKAYKKQVMGADEMTIDGLELMTTRRSHKALKNHPVRDSPGLTRSLADKRLSLYRTRYRCMEDSWTMLS